jgi:hypothetical protein
VISEASAREEAPYSQQFRNSLETYFKGSDRKLNNTNKIQIASSQ